MNGISNLSKRVQDWQPPEVSVNDFAIPAAWMRAELNALLVNWMEENHQDTVKPEQLEQFQAKAIDVAIEDYLMATESLARGLAIRLSTVELYFEKWKRARPRPGPWQLLWPEGDFAEDVARDLVVVKLLGEELYDSVPRPTLEETWQWYEANPERFRRPREFHVWGIGIEPKPGLKVGEIYEQLLNARERILASEPFEKVAAEVSDYPDAWNFGWVSKDFEFTSEVIDSLARLSLFEVSDVLRVSETYAIFQLRDRQEERVPPFEEIAQDVLYDLWSERKNQTWQQLADSLRQRAKICIQ